MVRLGAVSYLNVRPLVYGLDADADVSLRFDVPSECARLLNAGAIDLGMVPSITYLDRPGDRVVPGVCIGSEGPVVSVALFTRKPVREIATLALDTSSRNSAALVRVLCRRRFHVAPTFVPHGPDLDAMLAGADAALLIGDPALFLEPRADVEKIDLGSAWTDLTGLPFVWAFWAGAEGAADAATVRRLQRAAEEGMAVTDAIAAAYCADRRDRIALAQRYLRDNLLFHLTPRAVEGVHTFYREAAAAGVVTESGAVAFYEAGA